MRLLFLLLLGICGLVSSDESSVPCPLSLTIRNSSSHSVSLSWSFPCQDSGTIYKLHYSHLEWIACPFGTRSKEDEVGRGYVRTEESTFTLSGLIPYSRYRITVKALPGNTDIPFTEEFIVAETLSNTPGVSFGESVIPTDVKENSLQFFWRDPRTSLCKDFHGDIMHGRYIFKGEDPWNLHDEREGLISITDNSKEFEDLLPYSSYSFRLFTMNTEKMLNPEPLSLEARTLPSVPPTPINLEVLESSSKDDSVPLRWQPGYPPTGNVFRYVVKWKANEARNWLSSLSIPSSMAKDMCDDNDFKYNCYSIPELNTKRNLTFVITAYNEGVPENSEWSSGARFITNHTQASSYFPLDNKRGELAFWEILLIVMFSLVAFALLLGLFWIKCCRNGDRKYLSVPIYNLGGGKSAPRDLSSPLSRELSKSIQNIPLPPVPGEHVYEELPLKSGGKDLEYDEDMYLRPNKLSEAKSADSLDVSEYLVPTFPVVTDPSSLRSPDPPKPSSPIPIRSYEQKKLPTESLDKNTAS